MSRFDLGLKIRGAIVSALKICVGAWCLTALLVGCSSFETSNSLDDGIAFVADTGSPPMDSIVWSPQGDRILVTAGDIGQGRVEVYLLDMKTGKKAVLFETAYGDIVASTWSPDEKYVLLLARDNTINTGAGGLWIVDLENQSLHFFLDSGLAAWSPDGKKIATFSIKDIEGDSEKLTLSLVDISQKEKTPIYENVLLKQFFGLSWSPDEENIVFSLGEDEPGNLYIINLSTKKVTQITRNTRGTDPVWSPAGKIIAYVNWGAEGGRTTLHLLQVDSGCDIQVPSLDYVWSPTWSPNGRKIAFIGENGIYVLDTEIVFGRDIYQNLCP